MKLNSKAHGIIDYLGVVVLWLSPILFGLPAVTSIIAYGTGVILLVLSICTHYEFGLVKFIRFKVHGYVELGVSVLLVLTAFYLGSTEGNLARTYLLFLAIALLLFWLLSDYTNKPNATREIPFIESNIDGGMI